MHRSTSSRVFVDVIACSTLEYYRSARTSRVDRQIPVAYPLPAIFDVMMTSILTYDRTTKRNNGNCL